MSDNPRPGSVESVALPDYGVVRLQGRDAAAFAQSQFMNDVAALAPGRFQWNGWLNPKGRVQALFALLQLDAETLWMVGPGEPAGLAAALSRFVFRSRLRVEALPALQVHGRPGAPERAAGPVLDVAGSGTVELDLSGDAGARTLLIGGPPPPPDTSDARDAWLALDLLHGWPGIPGAALGAWTPQQLSLDRLSAFSIRKGCYPGQEIVARTHFLGRAKRGLALFDVDAASVGDAVVRAGQPWGEVIAATRSHALAVVALEHPAGPCEIGGQPAVERPPAGGMAR